MKWTAKSAEEVRQVFGPSFYEARTQPKSQPELTERVQLATYLNEIAFKPSCAFPIEVEHTRDSRPDFSVKFGGMTVGIEASQIANCELEQRRTHHRRESKETMGVPPGLLSGRSLDKMPTDSDCAQQFIFADPHQQFSEDEYWLKQAHAIIERKSEIMKNLEFKRYGGTWLLLWDKLGSSRVDLERRSVRLHESLRGRWHSGWFEKIIIQENDSPAFIEFHP